MEPGTGVALLLQNSAGVDFSFHTDYQRWVFERNKSCFLSGGATHLGRIGL